MEEGYTVHIFIYCNYRLGFYFRNSYIRNLQTDNNIILVASPKNKYTKALVIDTSHTARSIITTERAFVIKYKGNAEVVAEHPVPFGLVNKELKIMKPSIIKVSSYVDIDFHKVPLTRENVFKRDDYKCVYCGMGERRFLTLDHVHPKSKGGKDTWTNLVTACLGCNQEKDNLTIEEWGKDHPHPKRPHYLMLLRKTDFIPDEWKQYLLL